MRPSGWTDAIRRRWRPACGCVAGAALVVLSAGACRELATLVDVAFPTAVPGLPGDRPWVSLPVNRWLTEPGIEPIAISACFAPACAAPAAVMMFRAHGPEGIRLAQAAADPARLVAQLKAGPRAPADRRGRRPPRALASAEPASEGGLTGYAIRLERPGGGRSAAGYVLAASRGGATTALVIVTPTPDEAARLARAVAPRLAD
ncbi:hypothetical protein [Enterovirga rhinocerotis]|uniref:Uncharacterized protein n=1 Tax=Enterovirga rhinocerotis TaxID=1339210 RepID=A0A4R7BNJ8_9HYPH|nr:hypothetical protein [Enterovirga rhinocerotis]TDR87110.1 hypothetical protein EV668_4190 [Enterovirga rhinocerotis]